MPETDKKKLLLNGVSKPGRKVQLNNIKLVPCRINVDNQNLSLKNKIKILDTVLTSSEEADSISPLLARYK